MNGISSMKTSPLVRVRIGLVIAFLGLAIYVLGVKPSLFGLDRSPVMGFIQIIVFLIGLGLICLGGFLAINALWLNAEKSIMADIGQRLVSTGYVFAVACALADIFGFGSQTYPKIAYFGLWQFVGVLVGEFIILLGMIFLIPNPKHENVKASGDSPQPQA